MSLKSILRLAILTLAILLVPLMAMIFDWQFVDPGESTPESINWTIFDFALMGALIFGAGLVYEFLRGRVGGRLNSLLLGMVIVIALIVLWAELAVGIFGSPLAGN